MKNQNQAYFENPPLPELPQVQNPFSNAQEPYKQSYWSSSSQKSHSDSFSEENVVFYDSNSLPIVSQFALQPKTMPKILKSSKQTVYNVHLLKKVELSFSQKSMFNLAKRIHSLFDDEDEKSFKKMRQVKFEKIEEQKIFDLLVKKYQECFNPNTQNGTIWRCEACSFNICNNCSSGDQQQICPCSKQKIEKFKLTISSIPPPMCKFANLVPINRKIFYETHNKMSYDEIVEFEKRISYFMLENYSCHFSRISMFYDLEENGMFNLFLDPFVERAGNSLEDIYNKYRLGEYLPPIDIQKSKLGGFGVFARKQIQKNVFLFEYACDVLPSRVIKCQNDKVMKLSN